LKISDSMGGGRIAPAMPRRARLAMNIQALVEHAAMTDTTPKAAAPADEFGAAELSTWVAPGR